MKKQYAYYDGQKVSYEKDDALDNENVLVLFEDGTMRPVEKNRLLPYVPERALIHLISELVYAILEDGTVEGVVWIAEHLTKEEARLIYLREDVFNYIYGESSLGSSMALSWLSYEVWRTNTTFVLYGKKDGITKEKSFSDCEDLEVEFFNFFGTKIPEMWDEVYVYLLDRRGERHEACWLSEGVLVIKRPMEVLGGA